MGAKPGKHHLNQGIKTDFSSNGVLRPLMEYAEDTAPCGFLPQTQNWNLIKRKHQTNPNWETVYKITGLQSSKVSRPCSATWGHSKTATCKLALTTCWVCWALILNFSDYRTVNPHNDFLLCKLKKKKVSEFPLCHSSTRTQVQSLAQHSGLKRIAAAAV